MEESLPELVNDQEVGVVEPLEDLHQVAAKNTDGMEPGDIYT